MLKNRIQISCLVFTMLVSSAVKAEEPTRIVTRFEHSAKTMLAVVSEGNLEPRSIGSYCLRVYYLGNPDFPYDHFVTGLIMPRDGSLEKVLIADLNGDEVPEIIVTIRSAGTGSYLSADAFQFDGKHLIHYKSFSNLPKDTDPIQILKEDTVSK